ncbi:MAG: B12-binding radical protein [Chitinophagaceae bacterium]|nr:B12-binding radical protein [Chitinophagaceae bacterium]
MKKVLLFNPRSASSKYRIPNSILTVAASIHGKYGYAIVDGNLEKDPWIKIEEYLRTGEYGWFGSTVMPGPQLKQAIPVTKNIRQHFPEVNIVWGGYFPSNQYATVMNSDFVDYIINGPGDIAFPSLLDAVNDNRIEELAKIKNLIFKKDGEIVKTAKEELLNQDTLPPLPYDALGEFYSLDKYLSKTYLGKKTIAYHSSFGCPFTCSFCAVVPIYEGRWKGKSALNIYNDIKYLKQKYGGDAIEFHDNNFFVSEKRCVEFADLMKDEGMQWWGEARIDTMDKFSDSSLQKLRDSGCVMIFFGAETGDDAILKQMDKGGKQTGEQIKRFAGRMKQFGIIPEYSFVLGMPGSSPEKVMEQIEREIKFIKEIKEINPDTEIIIYIYSPVPTEGSELYKEVLKSGFKFPEKLEDWLDPKWESFDLRKNPLTPWLTAPMIDKIKGFETVLNGYYPTVSDIKLTPLKKKVIRTLASWRYKWSIHHWPYEIKVVQKFWLKYRQPEKEGF